ncbi:M1 family aminopeptidase [Hymenobacter sp. DG25A]|uniref:M1 family aminopeptidase n=1 Tax=Hymenobacter sp. DG25A TaxID=1385663 RepID=UPI0006C83566|nr:M1 family aminopeptidase [Hymenobacter sp. DG25A]
MRVLLFFCCLLPLLAGAQHRVAYQVHYAPHMSTEGLRVQVSVRTPKATDSTYFHFANEVWGEKDLLRCLSGFAGEGADYRFRIVPDSNRIVVYHPRTRDVRFSYRVKQDAQEYTRDQVNRPRVTDTYFHVLGESLFTVPDALAASPTPPNITATIRWVGFPQGYVLHNTFASGATVRTFRGKLWTEFYRSLYVGGDYRLHQLSYQNRPVYVAMRGQWQNYEEARVLSTIQQALTAQRDFWHDAGPTRYTVFMSPTVTATDSTWRGQSIRGEGLYQGFKLQSTNNPFNNWDLLRYMFHHEMLHDWIGGQITAAHQELNAWFTEGFTDYYAYKNRLRSGELTMEQWVQTFNADVIQRLYKNPERNQPNYLIKDNYWKNPSFGKLPYRRGALFAFWLDNLILKRSGYTRSLDDLMRELRQACLPPDQKFTDERFLALAQTYLQEDISYEFQKYILTGADLPLTKQDLIEGFDVDTSQPVPVLKATGDGAALRERYLNPKPVGKAVARE